MEPDTTPPTHLNLTEIDRAIAAAKTQFAAAEALGRPTAEALIGAAEVLRWELAEMQRLFDLQWKRTQEADALWRAEDPQARALTSPDLGVLISWLMGKAGFAPDAGPAVTDERLDADESIAALAVERELTAAELAAFTKNELFGPHDGATPADWIAQAHDQDAFLATVEPWAVAHFDGHVADLVRVHGLPQRAAGRLLAYALYATVAIGGEQLDKAPRTPEQLAHAAAPRMRAR